MITDLPYILSYREQQQLFLFDWNYIADILFHPGGASTLIGRFLVQFFYSPAAAVAITLLCLCGIGWFHRRQLPLIIAPLLFLLASLPDYRLHFDVVAACLFASAGFSIWERCSRKLLAGIVIPILLFFLAGSGAFLFAACAFAVSVGKGRWEGALPVAVSLLMGLVALSMNLIPTVGHSLSPVFFYDVSSAMPGFHLVFWILMPVAVLVSTLFGRFVRKRAAVVASCLLVLVAVPFSWSIFARQGKDGAYNIYKYEYHGVRGNWEKLEKITKERLEYPVTANWYYLAKSYRGTLLKDLMKNRHNREYDLLFIPEDRSTTTVLPHVLFRMGNMASAQNISFNLMFASCGYNPTLLKMQADIELVRGNYKVADKYLSLLERSLNYKKWARDRKRFLYNDAMVDDDPCLAEGRRDLPSTDGFVSPLYPMHALYSILRTNPSDKVAMEYGLAYLLLAKDIVNVAKFIEEFYGTPGLPELPPCAQEALCFFADYQQNLAHEEEFRHMDIDWCLRHGVQPQTISRMYDLQNATLQSGGKAPKGFRGTYWYYFLYDDMMVRDNTAKTEDNNAIY